eukprot:403351916
MEQQHSTQQISEELRQEMLKHTGFSQDQIKEHYDEVAEKYDQIYLNAGYHDHEHTAQLVNKFYADNKDIEILDMGCGTGLVGEELKKLGYNKIVGIDASQGMLDTASKKLAYHQLEELFLGKPDSFPEKFRSRFEIITASGILAQGHLGVEVFEEFLLALKQNGVAVFTTRTMYLEEYGYGKRMQEIVDEGRWQKLDEVAFDRYDNLGDEKVGRYQKVEVRAFAYKKL